MLSMLIAYDPEGNIIATLDHLVARDKDGKPTGLVDFDAHEAAGGKLRDVWDVQGASGSACWPEWLDARVRDFRVERDGQKRAVALVHKTSGHRRNRADVEQAVSARIAATETGSADVRDILGGPGRPLMLDADGLTLKVERPKRRPLPVIRAGSAPSPTDRQP